jgi:arsenate reductase-like glutaredoxin family protein
VRQKPARGRQQKGKNGMNIQIFGTARSFDTKKAQRWFQERGIRFQFIDLAQKPMSRGEFDSVKQALGGYEAMIDPAAKDRQTLALLQCLVEYQREDKLFENQQLLKMPIVRNGRRAAAGAAPEVWAAWLAQG